MNSALFRPSPLSRLFLLRLLFLALAPIALTLVAAGCGRASDVAGTDVAPTADAAPAPAVASDFRVRSEIIFTSRAALAFEVPGKVGSVNVGVGDFVSAGDVLATIDSKTITDLRYSEAQARFKIEQAQDELDRALGLESEDPLVRAQAENALALAESALTQAEVSLDRAQDRLDDFQLQYDVTLGDARGAVADATAGHDRAQKAQSDFADEHSERFAQALEARERARVALDTAEKARDDFLPNYDEALTKLRNDISNTEQDLDQARKALRDFDDDHADRLNNARRMLAEAQDDLDQAQENLDAFHLRIIEGSFRSLSEGRNFDVVQLEALQSAVASAQQATEKWRDEVVELEAGPKEFDRDAAVNLVSVLEDQLARLNRDLSDESAGPDQNQLAVLQAAVNTARERLSHADRDLAEVEEGVDQLELARLRAIVESSGLALDSAQNRLARLEEGPDQTELDALTQAVATARQGVIAARESRDDLAAGPDPAVVALAHANLDDAGVDLDEILEDLELAQLRAPFDGVVRWVTISPKDVITVDARVIELVDPGAVSVLGLVETNYIERIGVGTLASVTLGALPDVTLEAKALELSGEPRTERGVISYPVLFRVTVPADVAIPPNPGLVTTTILADDSDQTGSDGPQELRAPAKPGDN